MHGKLWRPTWFNSGGIGDSRLGIGFNSGLGIGGGSGVAVSSLYKDFWKCVGESYDYSTELGSPTTPTTYDELARRLNEEYATGDTGYDGGDDDSDVEMQDATDDDDGRDMVSQVYKLGTKVSKVFEDDHGVPRPFIGTIKSYGK